MHYAIFSPTQYSSWKIQACGIHYTTMKVSRSVNHRTTHQQLGGWSSSSSKSMPPLPIEVLALKYGQIYNFLSNIQKTNKQYNVTIGNYIGCSCISFVTMMATSLGKWAKWV
jgi:hypothetical protein